MAPAAKKELPVTFDAVRELALGLPQVEEGPCYGTPAFRVQGKLLARLREDGETLVVHVNPYERDSLMARAPETYFITDHYRNYPMVLVRLPAVDATELQERLEEAWVLRAPRRLVAAWQASNAGEE
jgi:hypothetical protein